MRLKAENDRLNQEIALLREEIRIKDARLLRIAPHKRPHYQPSERMAILQLRAARGWSQPQTADAFHLSVATVASWMKRLDEEGPSALVRLREPVNKFPDFVRYAMQRLKTHCPTMGKVKIAQVLCQAGLHLGTTTVGRILKERPQPRPAGTGAAPVRAVTARRPNHLWHVDLTTVPTGAGFWCSWSPLALPQCGPFCWWLAVVLDHWSRRVMGFALFDNRPTSRAVRTFLGRAIGRAGASLKHLISDKGKQFFCRGYRRWCRRRGIRLRYGAVGKQGSIAVVERFIGTLKREGTRCRLVPLRRERFVCELYLFIDWYNAHRPNMALGGRTPDELYHGLRPAQRRPRIEPRQRWPRRARCALPQTLVGGRPGARFDLVVDFVAGRRHLPVLCLKRAA